PYIVKFLVRLNPNATFEEWVKPGPGFYLSPGPWPVDTRTGWQVPGQAGCSGPGPVLAEVGQGIQGQ
ncbi:MAG: hypothetical protein WBH57_05635, partial [Anaerolineae bacterium]